MQVAYFQPDKLVPNPENPRVHPAGQIEKLAASIAEWGFNSPVVVNRSLMVLAGHGRLEAAKLLNMERIPVIVVEDLAELDQVAYSIADNKLSDMAGWDMNLLTAELAEIAKESFEDLKLTGFDPDEIQGLLDGLSADLGEAAKGPKAPEEDKKVRFQVGVFEFKISQDRYLAWKLALPVEKPEEVAELLLTRLFNARTAS